MSLFKRCIPALGAVFALLLMAAAPKPVLAQGDEIPKDLVALFQDVSDIESLRALNPLNLTADQIGRIAAAIRTVSAAHLKKVSAAASGIFTMEKEIKGLRKKLLTGGDVPEDFDRRGRKIQDEFVAKRDAEKNKSLKTLSDTVRGILTPEQVETAIKVSKKLTRKDGKPTLQGTDDQFFNFFVQAVLIDYPGILPLLDEIKKARSGAAEEKPPASAGNSSSKHFRKVARK